MNNETKTKQIETQEDLQTALIKVIGHEGGLFISRELRSFFKGKDIENKERWSVYARRTWNGEELIVRAEEVLSAQEVYQIVVNEFDRYMAIAQSKKPLFPCIQGL